MLEALIIVAVIFGIGGYTIGYWVGTKRPEDMPKRGQPKCLECDDTGIMSYYADGYGRPDPSSPIYCTCSAGVRVKREDDRQTRLTGMQREVEEWNQNS